MPRKFLITGGHGQLACSFKKILTSQNIPCMMFAHKDLDITNAESLESRIRNVRPDFILNCAAYNHVDLAEQKERDKAFSVNATAVKTLAQICESQSIFLVHFSTDAVFDGNKGELYTELDRPNPINAYGESKLAGEQYLNSSAAHFLLFRVSWVFGDGENNFLAKLRSLISKPDPLRIVCDRFSAPTSADDIAQIAFKALNSGLTGLYHLVNSGYASRYEFARFFLDVKEIDKELFPALSGDYSDSARRPFFSAMSNRKISAALNISIPDWQKSLRKYLISKGMKL